MTSVFTMFVRSSPLRMPLVLLAMCSIAFAGAGGKKRLLVLTDIGSDPDDQQSMVRLLLYANEFDLEGLVATSVRSKVNPEKIILEVRDAGRPALYGYRRIVVGG